MKSGSVTRRALISPRFRLPLARTRRSRSRIMSIANCRCTMIAVKLMDHFENDLSHHRIGANRARVIESATVENVRISSENFPLASCPSRFGMNTQKHRDVFVAVETVGNKEWGDDDGRIARQRWPVGN